MGLLFDEYFAGDAGWEDEWAKMLSLGEIVSDNMEVCEQLYFGD
jgi:hypothetical protein